MNGVYRADQMANEKRHGEKFTQWARLQRHLAELEKVDLTEIPYPRTRRQVDEYIRRIENHEVREEGRQEAEEERFDASEAFFDIDKFAPRKRVPLPTEHKRSRT